MIQVENLTKYYRDLCAVDRISFEIRKGEILGLLGPNGAGKTTTLRMLTGFLRPTSGSIRVKNLSIAEHSVEIKKLLGYLPESAPLYHDMLVYDYLDYVADIRSVTGDRKPSRVRELSDLCGLSAVMHKPIGELSKGYRQRVGLAHAMMSDPEILILDEPTSGLDPNQIVEIREIIRRIGREKTVILSTHILSEAEAACDRVVIIHQGKIAADGSMEQLKQYAGSEKVLHLLLEKAPPGETETFFSQIEGVSRVEHESASDGALIKIRIISRSPRDLRGEIYRRIRETDWILLEFQQESRSLENVFRELTREN